MLEKFKSKKVDVVVAIYGVFVGILEEYDDNYILISKTDKKGNKKETLLSRRAVIIIRLNNKE